MLTPINPLCVVRHVPTHVISPVLIGESLSVPEMAQLLEMNLPMLEGCIFCGLSLSLTGKVTTIYSQGFTFRVYANLDVPSDY